MADGEIREGIIGATFRYTYEDQDGTAINLSSASTRTCRLSAPDGTVTDKTAAYTTDGSDGVFQYTTISNDIDQAGEWQVEFHVVNATYDIWGSAKTVTVLDHLPAP